MAASDTYAMPSQVKETVKGYGYDVDTSMEEKVSEWWGWYIAENDWYSSTKTVNRRSFKVERASLHPARRVCREWASAILDDDATKFSVDDPVAEAAAQGEPAPEPRDGMPPEPERQDDEAEMASDLREEGVDDVSSESDLTASEDSTPTDELMDWVADTYFIPTAQRCLERAFATGTGALALWFDVGEDDAVSIRVRRYDARTILPLSWDAEEVTECAFVTRVHLHGATLTQLQMHVLRDEAGDATDTYHVITKLFDEDGDAVEDEGVIGDFDTLSDRPPFVIVRPAIDNVYSDDTAFGQSVFADAVDAVKAVDNAFDAVQREIAATKIKVFMSDDLFDVDAGGKPIPMDPDAEVIRMVQGNGAAQMIQTFAPSIRTQPLIDALDIALAQLGDSTGFGQNYFRFQKSGALKTAKEVTSDNAVFTRSLKKHENYLKPQLESLLGCVIDCSKRMNGGTVDVPTSVHVEFDDAIISDTDTEKTMMMSEIAAGVAPAWEYRETFRGETEDEARRMVGEAQGVEYDTDADLALDAG